MTEFLWKGKLQEQDKERLLKQFEEQGYVILKGIVEKEWIQAATTEMKVLVERHAQKLLSEGKISDTLAEESFETRFYSLYKQQMDSAPKSFRSELHLPGLFKVFFNPRLLDVVELFLGDEIRLYPNYTARPKFPEWEGTLVLWHQDAGYTEKNSEKVESGTSVNEFRMLNVWAPLVPARPENGCMQFIPGTHKLGIVLHENKEHYLEISDEFLLPHLKDVVDIILDPADIVLFNNLLFHCGQPNQSSTIRWSIDWRYQDLTQPTNRKDQGHVARSRSHPASAVQSAEEWANLTWR